MNEWFLIDELKFKNQFKFKRKIYLLNDIIEFSTENEFEVQVLFFVHLLFLSVSNSSLWFNSSRIQSETQNVWINTFSNKNH